MISNMDAISLLRGLSGVDLIFTSPPYNIGSKSPRMDGQRKHGKFDAKSYQGIVGYEDNLEEGIYQRRQVEVLRAMAGALSDDGVVVYNHKPRRRDGAMIHPMTWVGKVRELTLMEEIIWDRGSTHNHSKGLFWPTTERLYVLRRTDGRYRLDHKSNSLGNSFKKDLWRIPLSNKPHGGHACPYSELLAENVVRAFTKPGDLVCDPYLGSGTTGVAARRNGCRFVGAEIDSHFCNVAEQRIREAA
jgi:DNA modification methylase